MAKRYKRKQKIDFSAQLQEMADDVKRKSQNIIYTNMEKAKNNLTKVDRPMGVFRKPSAKPVPYNKRIPWEKYSSQWEIKSKRKGNTYLCVVHNKKKWALTHLLEFGHKTKGKSTGGKTTYTRKFNHIDAERQKCIENVKKELRQKL